MIGRIVDSENPVNNLPVTMIVLRADKHTEMKLLRVLRNMKDRNMRFSFDSDTKEIRFVLPDEARERLKHGKE